jgi:hypothetical protein
MKKDNYVQEAGRDIADANDPDQPAATGAGAVLGGAAGGVAGAAAAGAAAGGMTGPIGAGVGAVAGAVVGAMAGKSVPNAFDPVAEETYWRDNYPSRPYAVGTAYDEYRPAYSYGIDAYRRYPGRHFDEIEPELARDWQRRRGASRLDWDRAKMASRDAWQRLSDTVERAVPGDSDRDGK